MAKKWTYKQIDYLKNNIATKSNFEIGDVIGRSASAVKKYMQDNDIRRTPEQLHELRSRLSKRRNSSHYTVGHIPHNTNYDGHERITKDGYIEVRIRKGKYRLKHLYEWEKLNGKLPKRHCLRCIDGNIKNTNPSNWQLITREDNLKKNRIYNYPPELKKTIILKNKLKKAIKQLQKNE